jgi:hypothetical protein
LIQRGGENPTSTAFLLNGIDSNDEIVGQHGRVLPTEPVIFYFFKRPGHGVYVLRVESWRILNQTRFGCKWFAAWKMVTFC